MSDTLAGVNSRASGLAGSINHTISALPTLKDQEAAAATVEEFQQRVKTSSSNPPGRAPGIGILARNVTRLSTIPYGQSGRDGLPGSLRPFV